MRIYLYSDSEKVWNALGGSTMNVDQFFVSAHWVSRVVVKTVLNGGPSAKQCAVECKANGIVQKKE